MCCCFFGWGSDSEISGCDWSADGIQSHVTMLRRSAVSIFLFIVRNKAHRSLYSVYSDIAIIGIIACEDVDVVCPHTCIDHATELCISLRAAPSYSSRNVPGG